MRFHWGFCLFLFVCLEACGGAGGEGASAPTNVGEAIKAAEAAGTTPKLNRDDTVAGPDVDGNGVRDDIDTYIATLPDTEPQKFALKQTSSVLTKAMMVDVTNQTAVLEVARQIGLSTACSFSKYDGQTAAKKEAEIEKFTVNTKERFDAYMRFSKALSGHSWVLPRGDGCAN
jgi:hypothetical protein